MANILVHALAATAGGGATYLRNFLNRLADLGGQHRWMVLVPAEFEAVAPADHVRIVRHKSGRGAVRRIYYDQITLRRVIKDERIDLILATGNFGMLRPSVPQVLLNRNALYFSREHLFELRKRGDFRELLNTLMRRRLALASIQDSVANVVPTRSFALDIQAALPEIPQERFFVVPHGFERSAFMRPGTQFPERLQQLLAPKPLGKRLLMVSHYNYFRNFETVLKAMPLLKRELQGPFELVLTTKLGKGIKESRYDTSLAASIIEREGIGDQVVLLGNVPHQEIFPLYCSADVVLCPAYAESFGHPMVEAMTAGKPIVASDRPVQREMCGDAAVYFDTFDPQSLARQIAAVLNDPQLAHRLSLAGPPRAAQFTWERHFRELLEVIDIGLGRQKAAA
jgi:glycosyltransferase involved in cell wall biosynthesis